MDPELEQAHAHLASAADCLRRAMDKTGRAIDLLGATELAGLLCDAQRQLLEFTAQLKRPSPISPTSPPPDGRIKGPGRSGSRR
jgi:hypothetical protein